MFNQTHSDRLSLTNLHLSKTFSGSSGIVKISTATAIDLKLKLPVIMIPAIAISQIIPQSQ
jgi:hypothetical protein